jgi:hypothetical protein
MRAPLAIAMLLVLLPSGIRAQEPAQPRQEPPPPRILRVEPGPPSPLPEGELRILTMRRARLGISVNMRARETDSIGALIQGVTPNGPAAKAGLRSGDIITSFNGTALVGGNLKTGREQSPPGMALSLLAAGLDPGDTVAVEYRRGTDRRNASIVAGDEPFFSRFTTPDGGFGFAFGDSGEGPDGMVRSWSRVGPDGDTLRARLESRGVRERMRQAPPMMFVMGTQLEDLELAPLNPDLGRYFGTSKGILVINVPEDSKLGLKAGDVVLSVDGRAPASPAHLLRILRSYEGGEPMRLEIMRMKKRETVTGTLGEH